jgi:hypothetical protein
LAISLTYNYTNKKLITGLKALMPADIRSRIDTPYTPEPELPPAFKLVTLREAGDAFAHAMEIAPKEGAGTLVWVRRFDLVEFAVVLEPEAPLAAARRNHYVGMTAMMETLLVHAPPDRSLLFAWPDAILLEAGLVAGGRLGWPEGADEKQPPQFLVFGGMIRTAIMGVDPMQRPDAAALEEEGFEDLDSGRMLETFARQLMVWVHNTQTDGFADVAKFYLRRMPQDPDLERSIDGVGDLLERRKGKLDTEKKKLISALTNLDWYDPIERGLKL